MGNLFSVFIIFKRATKSPEFGCHQYLAMLIRCLVVLWLLWCFLCVVNVARDFGFREDLVYISYKSYMSSVLAIMIRLKNMKCLTQGSALQLSAFLFLVQKLATVQFKTIFKSKERLRKNSTLVQLEMNFFISILS